MERAAACQVRGRARAGAPAALPAHRVSVRVGRAVCAQGTPCAFGVCGMGAAYMAASLRAASPARPLRGRLSLPRAARCGCGAQQGPRPCSPAGGSAQCMTRCLCGALTAGGATAQVLVSTATLAWGVNLPAHKVIIKGTQARAGPAPRPAR